MMDFDFEFGPTTRIEPIRCPSCATLCDAATGIGRSAPKADDYTVCLYCAALLRYVAGVRPQLGAAGQELRPALAMAIVDENEARALRYAEPSTYEKLCTLMWAVREMKRERARMN